MYGTAITHRDSSQEELSLTFYIYIYRTPVTGRHLARVQVVCPTGLSSRWFAPLACRLTYAELCGFSLSLFCNYAELSAT